jgi:hypothetical protein
MMARNSTKKSVQNEASAFQKGISLFLMLMCSLYTFVLSNSLSAFRCFSQNDGSSTLISSPALECYDSVWISHIFVILFGLFVAISIPVYVFWILFSFTAVQRRRTNYFRWTFFFLCSPYRERYYWWEGVVLLKKFAFVLLVDLTNDMGLFERSFLLIVYFVFEIALESIFRPYREEDKSLLEVKISYAFFLLIYFDSLSE